MNNKIKVISIFIAVIWFSWLINLVLPYELNSFGILPRHSSGLAGIILSPFLHGNFQHIISNTIPLFILGLVTITFYEKIAFSVITITTIVSGTFVWLFARQAYHIGASGLIFGLAAFLVTSGIFRNNLKALLIAIVVFITYGAGMLLSFVYVPPGVSWEGHLFGVIAGTLTAFIYRRKKLK